MIKLTAKSPAQSSSPSYHEPVRSPSPASPITIPRASSHRWLGHIRKSVDYRVSTWIIRKSVDYRVSTWIIYMVFCYTWINHMELVDWKAFREPIMISLKLALIWPPIRPLILLFAFSFVQGLQPPAECHFALHTQCTGTLPPQRLHLARILHVLRNTAVTTSSPTPIPHLYEPYRATTHAIVHGKKTLEGWIKSLEGCYSWNI